MNISLRKKNFKSLDLLDKTIVLLILFRLILPFFLKIKGGDDSARYFISYTWSKFYLTDLKLSNIIIPDIDWLPLHFWFSGLLMVFFKHDEVLLFFHSLVSIISIYFFYKIAYILSNSKSVSKICVLLILLYPAHIDISSRFLSEPLYSFALIGAIFYLLKYINDSEFKSLCFNITFCLLAVLLRYEGWILAFSNILILVVFSYRSINFKKTCIMAAPLIAIFLLMLNTHFLGYGYFRFIITSDDQVSYFFKTFGYNYTQLLGFLPSWIPFSFIFYMVSILYITTKLYRAYFFIVLLMLIPFLFKVFSFTLVPDYRYATFYFCFFIIPIILLLKNLHKSKCKITIYIYAAVCSMVFLFSSASFFMISLKEKNTDFNSLKTFVSEIEEGGFLIDYYPIMRNYHLVSKLDLPLSLNYEDAFLEEHINFSAVNRVIKKSKPNKVCILFVTEVPEISYGERTKKENIKLALNNSAKTNYVIFTRDGLLNNYFDSIDNNLKRFDNKQFKKVFINETFRVYKEIENN